MLESLEKLRNGTYFPEGEHRTTDNEYGEKLADEIQAEIDRYYLPLPLFEDGEPAEIGMDVCYCHDDMIRKILYFEYFYDGLHICLERGGVIEGDECNHLKRPPESDTQEKIDADVARIAHGYATNTSVEESMAIEIEVLLARQRKLDGVE